jgi:hypothetical protein
MHKDIADAEIQLEEARSRTILKQNKLAELSRGIINFNFLKKRNMKNEPKLQTQTFRLSARN